ncbi:MAG: hypothetical protein RLZZ303_2959 [Candidatus Hydrogenedentota bacterium]
MPLRNCFATGLLLALVAGLFTGCPPEGSSNKPQAAFSADRREGAPPLSVRFTDESVPATAPIRAWDWDFGDGTRSSSPNPLKTYSNPGQYTVSLRVTSADGQSTLVRENYIRVIQNTTFSVIGPGGGTVAQLGAAVTVLPNVFSEEVAFGFRQDGVSFASPGEEAVNVVSAPLRISHSAPSPRVYASELGNAVQPATLTLTFDANSIPQSSRTGDYVFVLAQFEDTGRTVPIPGTVSGNTISVPVTNLPPRAVYVVAYRPQSLWVSATLEDDKAPTNFIWVPDGDVYYSETMLNQLTALRTGNLLNPSSFGRRNFTELDRNTTLAFIGDAIEAVYPELATSGLRSPRVINHGGKLKFLLFNMSPSYPTNFTSVTDVVFQDSFFGNLVVDPAQLLAISTRNGIEFSNDASKQDIAQVFTFQNAFAEGVMRAVLDGIEFPRVTTSTTLDGTVSALDGVANAAALYVGQTLDNLDARTFGPNERLLLDVPLFLPSAGTVKGYASAGHNFFTYVRNRYAPADDPLGFLTSSTPPNLGVLEAARFGLDVALQQEPNLPFEAALLAAADAVDDSMNALLEVSLAEAYKEYAIDMAFERSNESLLRPSDEAMPPFMFDPAEIDEDATLERMFIAPADSASLSASAISVLNDIAPLSSRVLVVDVDPLTTDVTISVNASDWPVDDKGNTVSLTAFQPGEAGIELPAGDNSLTLSGFMETTDCLDRLVILVSNTNLQSPVDVDITVSAVSLLDTPENEVLPDYLDVCQTEYSWEIESVGNVPGSASLASVLRLRTGAWRGAQDVTGGVWEHPLAIIVPPTVLSDTALLFVTGGSPDSLPAQEVGILAQLAEDSRSVVAVLAAVPNQPLTFDGETTTRSEDAILAYSFDEYLTGFEQGAPDKTWPALLPMTRAAVRAMDAVQEYLSTGNNSLVIRQFVVGGASKRGWTTWLTAASDSRVRAIIPIVADVLNLDEQMDHHFRSYGFYSSALQDYVDENVFDRLGTPQGQSLLGIVDPFSYVAELDMPKFIANSTGDQFFLPDSSRFYLDSLPGDNSIYFAPNTDHGLTSGELLRLDEGTVNSIFAWYISIIRNAQRPQFTYEFLDNRTVVIETSRTPSTIQLWQGNNTAARDFRLESFGPNWRSSNVTTTTPNRYVVTVSEPAQGWTAWFVQATFPGPDPALDLPYGFSTPVRVTPDLYPDEVGAN